MFNMVRFAEVFPVARIVHARSGQLSWTHLRQIVYLGDPLKRDFYAEMCRIERSDTRTLGKKIGSMLFERTALSRKPAKLGEMELKKLREEDKLTPDLVFRDPYLLDFHLKHGIERIVNGLPDESPSNVYHQLISFFATFA